jgi:tetratricopeptide (TPR) repeat protein
MNLRSLIVAMLVVPWFVAIAGAQPAPRVVSAEDKKKAGEHFERGRNAYNFGNYDVAISEYQAAFDLTGAAEFIFNIAQTHRTKGNKQAALETYKKYIAIDPGGAGVASARSHIEALEAELRAEEAAAAARKKAEEDAAKRRTQEAEAARIAAAKIARDEAAAAAKRRVDAAESAQRQKNARYFRVAGMLSTGAGVATIGVAGIFGLRARSLSREASDVTGMWTDEADRKVASADSSERTMFVLLGVGAAVAITGGVLYYVGRRSRSEASPTAPKVTVAPAPMTNGAALFVGGKF